MSKSRSGIAPRAAASTSLTPPRRAGRPSSSRRALLVSTTCLAIGIATAAQAGTITGNVTDFAGTVSLRGTQIEIVELSRRAEVESDGSYRFADVAPGTYTLRASYLGASSVDAPVTITGDELVRVNMIIGSATEEVVVVGQRGTMSSSLSRQRAADTIESVLTRDAIGQFPDQNIAESVRRVTGVNVLNDQGEGRYIAVRGLDPSLNTASINGMRAPAPEADTRAIALDVIPAELIESIEIKKSLTPDMDADSLGGSIEIKTAGGLDRKDPYVSIVGETSYNNLNGKASPKGSLDFAIPLSERFGIAGGLSYYRRAFSTDNVEMEGWDTTDADVVYADTLEYRDYDVVRWRRAGSLSLDYKPSDNTTLFARGLYSSYKDREFRGRLIFEMDEEPASGSADTAFFTADDGEIQVVRDHKFRTETQTITSLTGGGKTYAGAWTLDYSVGWSYADEIEKGSLDPIEFQQEFDGAGQLDIAFDYANPWKPWYTVAIANRAAFLDPAAYEFDKLERTTLSDSQDKETTFKFDATRNFALAQGDIDLKFGGKARLREKSYNLTLDVFDGYGGNTFTVANLVGKQSYGIATIDPVVDPWKHQAFVDNNIGLFELDPIDTAFESAVEDYVVKEDIYAGYLMARYDNGQIKAVGGVRIEHTENDIRGNRVELVEEGGIRDGVELDEDTVFVTPTQYKRSYTDWLPSVNFTYETDNDLLFRLAGYRNVLRPNIGNIAPRFLIEESDDGEREGEFGNPDLKPYNAWNFDASIEWYFDNRGVLQAGYFHKSISDFIVMAQFEDVTFNGIFAHEATIPINGDKATVHGLEFGYQQVLNFLPEPLDGFLVSFNYTYTDAKGSVGGRSIPLPASSKHTYNAALGYEKGPVSLRFAASYRSSYLDELGDSADEDRYVKSHIQFDVTGKYRLTDNVQVFAELINLGDEPYIAYQRGPSRDRLLQYEEYSWTGKAGVRVTF